MTFKVTLIVEANVGDGPETPDEVTSAVAGFFREQLGDSVISRQYEDGKSIICAGRVSVREISAVYARALIQ